MAVNRPIFETIDCGIRATMISMIVEICDKTNGTRVEIDMSSEERKQCYDWLRNHEYLKFQAGVFIESQMGGRVVSAQCGTPPNGILIGLQKDWQVLLAWLQAKVEHATVPGLADEN